MAAFKVLFVAGGPAALVGVRALNFTLPGNVFTASGDNAMTFYHGRKGPATGMATVEDAEKAELFYDLDVVASAVFTCKSEAGATINVTVTNMIAGSVSFNAGDGTAGGPVPGWEVAFMASEIAVAPA